MPTKIDFRDCVHHGIAGPTPDHILASIRAEYCLPPNTPVQQMPGARRQKITIEAEDFAGLARALGSAAFRQLLTDLRRSGRDLRALPDFLAQHRYGRATAALVDLARLELALAFSERAPDVRSVGACCLPPALLRSHPDLTLTFHPAWQWLDLATPADQWRGALLDHDAAEVPPPLPRATRLRLSPDQGRTVTERLSPALFAFEHALQTGATLRQADEAGRLHTTASFESIQSLLALLIAGAVIDVELHPAHHAPTPEAHPMEMLP